MLTGPSQTLKHMFSCAGYEELTAGPAGVDYSKGYNSSSQTQAKSAAAGPGKGKKNNSVFLLLLFVVVLFFKSINVVLVMLPGVSVTSSNSGVPDISGSVYNKTQVSPKHHIWLCCKISVIINERSTNEPHLFCSLLISRVSMQGPPLPLACHQRWGVQGL